MRLENELKPERKDGKRLRKRCEKCRNGLPVFVTDWDVPFGSSETERATRRSAMPRKVTNEFRSERGADAAFAIRSATDTGNLNGRCLCEAIGQISQAGSIFNPEEPPRRVIACRQYNRVFP